MRLDKKKKWGRWCAISKWTCEYFLCVDLSPPKLFLLCCCFWIGHIMRFCGTEAALYSPKPDLCTEMILSNCGHRMQETIESLRRSPPFCSWPLPRQSWDQIRNVPFHRWGTLPTELWGGLLLSFSAVTRALQRPENEECYLSWEELSLILARVCLGQRLHSHGSRRNLTSLSSLLWHTVPGQWWGS